MLIIPSQYRLSKVNIRCRRRVTRKDRLSKNKSGTQGAQTACSRRPREDRNGHGNVHAVLMDQRTRACRTSFERAVGVPGDACRLDSVVDLGCYLGGFDHGHLRPSTKGLREITRCPKLADSPRLRPFADFQRQVWVAGIATTNRGPPMSAALSRAPLVNVISRVTMIDLPAINSAIAGHPAAGLRNRRYCIC